MVIATRLEDIKIREDQRTCITLGKFDGIHRGHQKLFEVCREKSNGDILTAFTFDFSIRKVLTGKMNGNLFSKEEKRALMSEQGVELLVECPFTDDIRTMEPDRFVRDILVNKLHARTIIIGDDFHFGCNRAGDAGLLQSMSKECGYEFFRVDMVTDKRGLEIGSTEIREALLQGRMEVVNELLGFAYFADGRVVHGNHIGGKIGSPTINQLPGEDKLLPPFGVYCSKVIIDGREYKAVTNIGCKPTVSDGKIPGIETYILDFNEKIYGENVRTCLYHYLRPERVFECVDELAKQIKIDSENAARYWSEVD